MNQQLSGSNTPFGNLALHVPRACATHVKRMIEQKRSGVISTSQGTVIPCKRRVSRPHAQKKSNQVFFALGGVLLALAFAQDANMGMVMLPAVGLLFLMRGMLLGSGLWLMYGGILSGVGMGLLATEGPLHLASGDAGGCLFLMASALGLLSISFLSRRYTCQTQWWPLIPGAMLAMTALFLIV